MKRWEMRDRDNDTQAISVRRTRNASSLKGGSDRGSGITSKPPVEETQTSLALGPDCSR
jgi:hypothetical protein